MYVRNEIDRVGIEIEIVRIEIKLVWIEFIDMLKEICWYIEMKLVWVGFELKLIYHVC